jgi:hypothetical protein
MLSLVSHSLSLLDDFLGAMTLQVVPSMPRWPMGRTEFRSLELYECCYRYRYRVPGGYWMVDLSLSVLGPDERFVNTDTGCREYFGWPVFRCQCFANFGQMSACSMLSMP